MDRYEPDRPSIFTRPPDDDEMGPAREIPPDARRTTDPWQTPVTARADPAGAIIDADDAGPPRRRRMLLFAAPVAAILVLIGVWAGSLVQRPETLALESAPATATPSPTPTASPTATPEPTPSPEPSPTATAVGTPTPAPTAPPPPAELRVGAWGRITTDSLNVRSAPGLASGEVNRLVEGAIVHVFEGPRAQDGFNWYRVSSLGGVRGWAASGPRPNPFVVTFTSEEYLIECGPVSSEVLSVVDGAVRVHDPIRIGEFAVPAGGFGPLQIGALELLRGTRNEACFAARVEANETIVIDADLQVEACGRPVRDGSVFSLRPSAGQEVGLEAQVKQSAIIHPALLTGRQATDAISTNLRGAMSLVAAIDGGTNCISAYVRNDPLQSHHSLHSQACVVVVEVAADVVTLRPGSGGDAVRFARTPEWYVEELVASAGRTMVWIGVSLYPGDAYTSIHHGWGSC